MRVLQHFQVAGPAPTTIAPYTEPFLDPGQDGTGAVLPPGSGNIVAITGSETTAIGFIGMDYIPEPATGGLLLLGLWGLRALAPGRRP